MSEAPLWITESDVVAMMHLGQAIDALESGLKLQASGGAQNMTKTHVTWGGAHTLHAIGATYEGAGVVGTKTWAHTEGGATPLVILWDSHTGALLAIIEAFALGQMRTGGISGVATRWMAAEDADTFALFGTGKQAMTQLAAVAAVRKLRRVRIFGRDAERRDKFVAQAARHEFGFDIEPVSDARAAAAGAQIITLVTRAREPFLSSAMVERGAHINAVGAITPEREEFSQDLFPRVGLIAADDPPSARNLSKEFRDRFGQSDEAWRAVVPLAGLAAAGRPRPKDCDVSIFKAMGMGVSDLALGIELLRRARAEKRGREIEPPKKATPRLR
jgi:ornithine cyclodeaminase